MGHLSRLPAYEALSYCWGEIGDNLPTILLHGHTFEVTKNLHGALFRLRRHTEPRLLWVDAVCINQKDVQECNSQVVLMDQIYRRATSVVIWLGDPIMVDGKDIWSIPPLLEAAQKGLKRTELPIRHGIKDWVKFVLSNDWTTNGDLMDKRWNAIIKGLILLLQRPWFLRTWIIQEAALAKHAIVVCGNNWVSWDDFYRALSYAVDLSYFSSTVPEMYSSARSIELGPCYSGTHCLAIGALIPQGLGLCMAQIISHSGHAQLIHCHHERTIIFCSDLRLQFIIQLILYVFYGPCS